MSLLGNLKKIKDAAVKKVKDTFAPPPKKGNNVQNAINAATGGLSGGKSNVPGSPADIAKKAAAASGTALGYSNYNYGLKPKNNVQAAIDKATGGVAGPKSMVPTGNKVQDAINAATGGKKGGSSKSGGGGGSSSKINTSFMSLGSPDYSYGLGDIGLSSSSQSSSPTTTYNTGSGSVSGGSGGGGGAGGASSIADQLSQVEAEARRIQAEVDKMAKQGETAADGAVASDTEEVNYEKEALRKLKEAGLLPDDSGLDMLNDEIRRNEQNLKDNLANVNAGYNVQQTGMQNAQLGETGQLSAQIANAGGYLGFSGSGTGVMLKLAESHRAELVSLESQRQNALQEARNAAAERRFDIVRLKADEIARIDQEKYERVQEYNKEVKAQAQADLEKAKTLKTQSDIMEAIGGGATTVEDIFNKLKGTVSVEEIKSVLGATTKSASSIGSGFKLTSSNTASLMGAGMTQDDVAALNEYVNENGYDEAIRSQLPPAQRAAADKIFKVGGLGGGGIGSTKPLTTAQLDAIEEREGLRFPFGTSEAQAIEFMNANSDLSAEEKQALLDGLPAGQKTETVNVDFMKNWIYQNIPSDEWDILSANYGANSILTPEYYTGNWWPGTSDVDRMFSTPAIMQKIVAKYQMGKGMKLEGDALKQYILGE